MVDQLLTGVDVLIHLAGTSVERPLPEIIENNLVGLFQIYEGARRNQVRRIVFASSNHAFGMYPVNDKLTLDGRIRPDGFYGLSQGLGRGDGADVLGQARHRGHLGAHRHRDGQAAREFRQLSTWFGTDDLVDLMMRCIEAPEVGYMEVWGISNNTRATTKTSRTTGWATPRQNAEEFAPEILKQHNPLDPIAKQYQGGQFVTIDFTPMEQRTRR